MASIASLGVTVDVESGEGLRQRRAASPADWDGDLVVFDGEVVHVNVWAWGNQPKGWGWFGLGGRLPR